MNIRIKDSRGRESTTLTFVSIAFAVLVIKFAAAGITIGSIATPPMTGGEFAAAMAAIMATWLGREYTEKVSSNVPA